MLKKITIDNFKSLKHLEYNCAGLNLLTGMNGAGKSSFVQFLDLVRAVSKDGFESDTKFSLRDVGYQGKFADLKYCYAADKEDISFSIDVKWRDTIRATDAGAFECSSTILNHLAGLGNAPVKDVQRLSRCLRDGGRGNVWMFHPMFCEQVMHSPEAAKYLHFVQENGGHEKLRRLDFSTAERRQYEELTRSVIALKKKVSVRVSEEERDVADELRELWKHAQKIDAFRGNPECVRTGGKLDEASNAVYECRYNSEGNDVVEFLEKYGRVFELYKDNPMLFGGEKGDSICLMDEVNKWMGVVSPGVSIEIESVQCGDDEELVEKIGFGSGDLKRTFKPRNVGFGIDYTLPVIVALLTAQPEDIVIIENPEAHLHPRGQAAMGNLIARAVSFGVQVFVETHSDHVINGIRVAVKKGVVKPEDVNIAFFERKPHDVPQEDGTTKREIYSEVTNIKVDANGALSEWPKDFMDEWGIQQMKLLRP